MRRRAARDQTYFGQAQRLGDLLRQPQMAVVNRVESAAEYPDRGDVGIRHRLKHQATDIGQHAAQESDKTRALRAVDHGMIIRERQRQHEARRELLAVPYRPGYRFADAEYRNFRRIDYRRKQRATKSAQARYRKAASLQVGGIDLAVAHAGADCTELFCKLEQPFRIGIADHRHDESKRRIDRHADMEILLEDQILAGRG